MTTRIGNLQKHQSYHFYNVVGVEKQDNGNSCKGCSPNRRMTSKQWDLYIASWHLCDNERRNSISIKNVNNTFFQISHSLYISFGLH